MARDDDVVAIPRKASPAAHLPTKCRLTVAAERTARDEKLLQFLVVIRDT
jgi:hypothetical protein